MAAAQQESIDAAGDGSVRYYLIIDGMDGGSASESFPHSFEIDAFSLGLNNAAGDGSVAGKTTFDPLKIDFASGAAADEITRALFSGEHISSVRLVGMTTGESPQTVYDLRLGGAIFTDFAQALDGDHLSIDYSKITLTTPDSHGMLETGGWDRLQSKALTDPLPVPTAIDDNADAGTGPLTWYLTIDGLDGGSTAEGHKGAFELSAFQFNKALAVAIEGGGTGKPTFDPIALKLDFGSAADEILAYVAGARSVPAVQIEGVTQDGLSAYDLRLAGALLRAGDLNDGMDRLKIDYTRFSLTTTNSLGSSETISYDRATNKSLGTTPLAEAAASDENAMGSGDGTVYYLTIDGLDGGSTVKGHKGAFEISGFDFDLFNTGLNFSGTGTGKTKFNPIDIDFDAGGDTTRLLQYISTGKHIDSIRITGDAPVDGAPTPTGFDLRMSGVTLKSFLESHNGDHLTLNYGKYSLTAKNTDGVKETSGWDIAANKALSTQLAAPTPADRNGAEAADDMHYYLVIGGMDGGSDVEKHKGGFAVGGFHFDANNAGGKPSFGNLEIDLKLGSAARDLIALAASGNSLKSIQLVGDTSGETPRTVYDLRLGGARLDTIFDTDAGQDHLSFDFNKYSLATLNDAGKRSFYGFDLGSNASLADELPPAGKAAMGGTAGGNLQYYMTIDGLDGGSVREGHAASFELDDFDFNFSKLAQTGALDVKLDIGSAGDELLNLIATGNHIKHVELVGESLNPDAVKNPYDLRLGNVTLTKFEQNADGRDTIGLHFSKFSLTTKDADKLPHTSGYDLSTGKVLATPLGIAQAVKDFGAAGGADGYHLMIDGLDGGDRHKDRVGAFDVDSFDFDVAAAAAAGAGKTTFKPIEVSFHAGSAADELFQLISAGASVGKAEIVGDIDGEQTFRSFDLRLADVHLSRFHQGSDDDLITLRFDALSLTTASMTDTGATHKETYAFDLDTWKGSTEPLPAAVPQI
jgi:type VI protein secretion system component Hcp